MNSSSVDALSLDIAGVTCSTKSRRIDKAYFVRRHEPLDGRSSRCIRALL